MPQSDRVIQVDPPHSQTEINKARKHFARHALQLVVGGVGLGAGVTVAADAFKTGGSLVLIAVAFVIGGFSFVFASIAIENLPNDYTCLRKVRAGNVDR